MYEAERRLVNCPSWPVRNLLLLLYEVHQSLPRVEVQKTGCCKKRNTARMRSQGGRCRAILA